MVSAQLSKPIKRLGFQIIRKLSLTHTLSLSVFLSLFLHIKRAKFRRLSQPQPLLPLLLPLYPLLLTPHSLSLSLSLSLWVISSNTLSAIGGELYLIGKTAIFFLLLLHSRFVFFIFPSKYPFVSRENVEYREKEVKFWIFVLFSLMGFWRTAKTWVRVSQSNCIGFSFQWRFLVSVFGSWNSRLYMSIVCFVL